MSYFILQLVLAKLQPAFRNILNGKVTCKNFNGEILLTWGPCIFLLSPKNNY